MTTKEIIKDLQYEISELHKEYSRLMERCQYSLDVVNERILNLENKIKNEVKLTIEVKRGVKIWPSNLYG